MTDLRYHLEVDYERTYDPNDYYQRHSKIYNEHIVSLELDSIIKLLFEVIVDDPEKQSNITKYCFDRICRINKIWDKSEYEITTCSGYYGEEINEVFFQNEYDIEKDWEEIKDLPPTDQIKAVLKMEYGYVLPQLLPLENVTIIRINKNQLQIPNNEYYHRMDRDVLKSYENYNGPLGVITDTGNGRYRLIDGNHRVATNAADEAYFIYLS